MNNNLIAKILVLSCISCTLSQRWNVTGLFDRTLFPRLLASGTLQDMPASTDLRDITYLPEEDYDNGAVEAEMVESQELNRNDRNLKPEYRNLCETKTKKVQLSDSDFEYQPPHYHEIYCKSYSFIEQIGTSAKLSKQMCAHPSFHCVQRSRTLFLARRRWSSECWEPITKEVASGCDCMWPVSVLGDITGHY